MQKHKKGYGNHLNALGYAPKSAVHLAESKYCRLVELECNQLEELVEQVGKEAGAAMYGQAGHMFTVNCEQEA